MIRGLDDDEVGFLEHVDRVKIELERQQKAEERKFLDELKQRPSVFISSKDIIDAERNELNSKPKSITTNTQPSQKKLLAGIVRKRTSNEAIAPELATNGSESTKKLKTDTTSERLSGIQVAGLLPVATTAASSSLKCIGILPGIGSYKDTSDSNDSSDAGSPTQYDFVGRKIKHDCE